MDYTDMFARSDHQSATVVHLHSHPAWVAAQQREQRRQEAMRRHPSYQSRLSGAALAEAALDGTNVDQLGLRRAAKAVPMPEWLPAN